MCPMLDGSVKQTRSTLNRDRLENIVQAFVEHLVDIDFQLDPACVRFEVEISAYMEGKIKGHVVEFEGNPLDRDNLEVMSNCNFTKVHVPGQGWIEEESSDDKAD